MNATAQRLTTNPSMEKSDPAKGERVLLIVHEEGVRVMLNAILRRTLGSVEIDSAELGEQALLQIGSMITEDEQDPYDLVISDVMLPGVVDGIEVWKHLKKTYPNMAFILISRITANEFWKRMRLQSGLTHGYPAFLRTPFNIQDCKDLIDLLVVSKNLDPEA